MGPMCSFDVMHFRRSVFCSMGDSKFCGLGVSFNSSATFHHYRSHVDGLDFCW